jgi:hypothetical protein
MGAGFQVLGESAENQGEPGFSFPQLGLFRTATGQQPRRAVVWLRKRFYAGALGKRQHRDGQDDRQQRSHSSPPPHCPRQGYLSPQPVDAGGAAGIPGSLLGFNGSDTPVGVGVHVRSVR